jgi:hypothetical protein
VDAIGRQVEPEQLDRDEALVLGIVTAENRTKGACPDLMENAEWTEGVRGRAADSFRVQ